MKLKDDRLAELADRGNVARFVSFTPGAEPRLRYARIDPLAVTSGDKVTVEAAVEQLFHQSSGRLNVRTFTSAVSKGLPFLYGLTDPGSVVTEVRRLALAGYFTIVNETVDVDDGGISGVSIGGWVEFAPDDTPRAVEKSGTAGLPRTLASTVLTTVYGFEPSIQHKDSERLEFSVHPRRVGYRGDHSIWWEVEDVGEQQLSSTPDWPNNFSRHIGDKAYGLLMAESIGLHVPRTTVVSRRVAPFTFGLATGTREVWIRTCPVEQAPGQYSTFDHWVDPFRLLHAEDPSGTALSSIIAQEGVDAIWAGATLPAFDGNDYVEGKPGTGDRFMLGREGGSALPSAVTSDVQALTRAAASVFGPVRIEWCHDGRRAWVVQMHTSRDYFVDVDILSQGDASEWISYDTTLGLDALKEVIAEAVRRGVGVSVDGHVGITSHVGDLLRRARVPGRLAAKYSRR